MRYFQKYPLFLSLIFMLMVSPAIKVSAAEPTVLLDIPVDRQDKALSCEVASLKMALRYKSVWPLTEDQLTAIVGLNGPIKRAGNVWGDPDLGFVGLIRGRQNTTGYGVHWQPIARAAQNFLPESQAFQGLNASQMAAELAAGNPIIIWGLYGKSWPDSWTTPEGRTVQAWRGEHTRVIIGFTGDVNDPQEFILIDPLNGKIRWPTAKLLANSAPFGNSGVVVK